MTEFLLGPDLTPAGRSRHVVIALPDWGDTATWESNYTPQSGTVLTDLVSRQPADLVEFAPAGQTLQLLGSRTDRAAVDVVSVLLATASASAIWSVGVGDDYLEALGLRAKDASGHTTHGTAINGASWTAGHEGGGLLLNNPDGATLTQCLNTAFLPILAATQMSYVLWIKPRRFGPGNIQMLVINLGGGATRAEIRFGLDGRVSADNGAGVHLEAVTACTGGTWAHVAVTYDGVTLRLYLNGVEEASAACAGFGDGESATGLWWGGSYHAVNGFAPNGFDGVLDDCRYYDGALSAAEIQTAMQSESATDSAATLLLHYRLNAYHSGWRPFGISPNAASDERRSSFLLLPYRLTSRYVIVSITDATAIASLRIGRLFVGSADQPARNYDEGYALTLSDDTKPIRTPGGQTLVDAHPVVPGLDFTLEHVSRAEALGLWRRKYQRQVGTSQPLLVCLDPEAEDDMDALLCYGRLRELSALAPRYYNGWQVRWSVEAFL